MRQRRDQNGVFLTAADIFSLLSLALIAVAVFMPETFKQDEQLPLPELPASAPTEVRQDESVEVRWAGGEAMSAPNSSSCTVFVTAAGALAPREVGPIRCWPRSFGGTFSGGLDSLAGVDSDLAPGSHVTIGCSQSDLIGCARLQWVLAELGYRVSARVVRSPEQ